MMALFRFMALFTFPMAVTRGACPFDVVKIKQRG